MKLINSFSTVRTRARKMTQGDLYELVEMYQDGRVMKTLGGEMTREQALASLERNLAHFTQHGFGYWVFEDAFTGAFMGRAGLLHTHIAGSDEVELGYGFLSEYWGKGVATEVAQKILSIGFEEIGLEEIVCFSLPDNKASQRVMQKIGFTFEKECEYKGLPHVLYRLTKDRWQELQGV